MGNKIYLLTNEDMTDDFMAYCPKGMHVTDDYYLLVSEGTTGCIRIYKLLYEGEEKPMEEDNYYQPVLDHIDCNVAYIDYELSFQATATDADGDELYYEIIGLPPGADFDSSTGHFSWTPTVNERCPMPTTPDSWIFTIIVHDGRGGSDWQKLSIPVRYTKPEKPENIFPADGAVGINTRIVELNWDNARDALTYDVYFGTNPNSLEKLPWPLHDYSYFHKYQLKPNTTYYWQVVCGNPDESTEGDIWSFSTGEDRFEITTIDTPLSKVVKLSVNGPWFEDEFESGGQIYKYVNWYKFTTGDFGEYTLNVSLITLSEIRVSIYSEYKGYTVQGSFCDPWFINPDGSRSIELEGNTTYYIRANQHVSTETGRYKLRVSGPVDCIGDDHGCFVTGASRTPVGIVISGLSKIDVVNLEPSGEDEPPFTSYTATAYFTEGTTKDISEIVRWSENSDYASINTDGVFEIKEADVPSDEKVTIIASLDSRHVTPYGFNNSYVEVESFPLLEPWTISALVKPRAVVLNTNMNIVSRYTNFTFGLESKAVGGMPNLFTVRLGSKTFAQDTEDAIAGEWYHLTAVCDGMELKLYVNGQEKNSALKHVNEVDLAIGGSNILIGSDRRGGFECWDGLISEVCIYDRVLTPEEVVSNYHGDIIKDDSLVLHHDYTLGHARDLSNHEHDGTLINQPEFIQDGNNFIGLDFSKKEGKIEAYWDVLINYKRISHLEISGKSSLNENSSAGYRVICHYDDGSAEDVSNSSKIYTTSGFEITSGVLTVGEISTRKITITIEADYYDLHVSKELTIYNIAELIIKDIPVNTEIQGTCDPLNRYDGYRFTPDHTGFYEILTTDNNPGLLRYTFDIHRLKFTLHGPNDLNRQIEIPQYNEDYEDTVVELEAGETYYLKIDNGSWDYKREDYTLNIRYMYPSDPDIILTGLSVYGPDEMDLYDYQPVKAIAHFSNGLSGDITWLAEWADDSDHARIRVDAQYPTSISPPHVVTESSGDDSTVTITASFTHQGITKTDTANFVIRDRFDVKIEGPLKIYENSSADYRAFAIFNDMTEWMDITNAVSTSWAAKKTCSDCPGYAGFDPSRPGHLITSDAPFSPHTNLNVEVYYQYYDKYADRNIGKKAILEVQIKDIPMPEEIAIAGPSIVKENTSEDYTVTAFFDDNTQPDVTNSVQWSVDSDYVAMDEGGRLNIGIIPSGDKRDFILTAKYTYKNILDVEVTKTNSIMINIGAVQVPRDYPTIQEAIDTVNDGTVIIVSQGTYVENINLSDKAITLMSMDPDDPDVAANTIIDGNQTGSVITIINEQEVSQEIRGLTIQNGKAGNGGGIYCEGGSPIISKSIIQNNTAENGNGGGIYSTYGSPLINTCTIKGNNVTGNASGGKGNGGAIYSGEDSAIRIENCIITGNEDGSGGTITGLHNCLSMEISNCIVSENIGKEAIILFVSRNANLSLINCTVANNQGRYGLATYSVNDIDIINSILWGNESNNKFNIMNIAYGNKNVTNSVIGGGLTWGNNIINKDPLFRDTGIGDYRLQYDSPCIDTGVEVDLDRDIEGNSRPQGAGYDMGAYESSPELIPEVNHDPIINPIGDKTVNIGTELTFQISALDEDGDRLNYNVSGLPSGAQIDLSTGVFTWTPNPDDHGDHQAACTVSDGLGGSDTQDIIIRVNKTLISLSITDTVNNVVIKENSSINYTATAHFSDNSTEDVTTSASWSINSDYASMDLSVKGQLNVTDVPGDITIKVTASYSYEGVLKNAEYPVTIIDIPSDPVIPESDDSEPIPPVTLTRVKVTGANSVYENSSANYTATAYFSNDTTQKVTNAVTWSENSSYATMDSARKGRLNTREVSSNKTVRLTASYTYEGITKTGTKSITIKNYIPDLTDLQITGQGEVDVCSSADYTAMAYYSDGSSKNVTGSLDWSENSPYAFMDSYHKGRLNIGDAPANHSITVTARYTYNGITKTDSKTCKIPPANERILVGIYIAGELEVEENSYEDYKTLAIFSDQYTEVVTDSTIWKVESEYAAMDPSVKGRLNANEVILDTKITITATYTYNGITKSEAMKVTIKDKPVYLEDIKIIGVNEIDENLSADYSVTAVFSDDTTKNVTNSIKWKEDSTYAFMSMSERNKLKTKEVPSDTTFTLTASYSFEGVTRDAYIDIMIINVNNPPELDDIGNKTIEAGQELTFQITAMDDHDGGNLNYSSSILPSGADLNPATGDFTWSPSTKGQYTITFTVTDSQGTSDSERITITVTKFEPIEQEDKTGEKSEPVIDKNEEDTEKSNQWSGLNTPSSHFGATNNFKVPTNSTTGILSNTYTPLASTLFLTQGSNYYSSAPNYTSSLPATSSFSGSSSSIYQPASTYSTSYPLTSYSNTPYANYGVGGYGVPSYGVRLANPIIGIGVYVPCPPQPGFFAGLPFGFRF